MMNTTQVKLHNLNERLTSFLLTGGVLSRRPSRSDRGAAMVEYALLIVLIALVAVAALRLLGTEVSSTVEDPDLINSLS